MTNLIHDDFLLQTRAARKLYEEYAAQQPIIDYHNHLPPNEINENKQFSNITEIWLKGDHYKWRAMRASGVNEKVITGDASDKEKFLAWAKTVPLTLKNPLYHWTHLELKRYFDIDELLNESNAEKVWDHVNELLQTPDFATRRLLEKMNVEVVCTTDDAVDTLEHHKAFAGSPHSDKTINSSSGKVDINGNNLENDTSFVMYPTYRPDNAMKVEDPVAFGDYVQKLQDSSGITVENYNSFLEALRNRHDFFNSMGCRASDHGIEEPYAENYTEDEVADTFEKVLDGQNVSEAENRKFKSALMHEFAVMDFERGWAFQMHIGALRNNNTRGFNNLGADKGFDSIGDFQISRSLSRFLDRLELSNQLPRTIIYNLNPADNAVISTMIGNFMGDGIAGKVQHGAAWWFHDQKEGMEDHLQTLANMGLLSQFVGMVTDSRSFLSFPRHEYYRRILCNMLGSDIENGIVPEDFELVGSMVKRLCYDNALEYFSFME